MPNVRNNNDNNNNNRTAVNVTTEKCHEEVEKAHHSEGKKCTTSSPHKRRENSIKEGTNIPEMGKTISPTNQKLLKERDSTEFRFFFEQKETESC